MPIFQVIDKSGNALASFFTAYDAEQFGHQQANFDELFLTECLKGL